MSQSVSSDNIFTARCVEVKDGIAKLLLCYNMTPLSYYGKPIFIKAVGPFVEGCVYGVVFKNGRSISISQNGDELTVANDCVFFETSAFLVSEKTVLGVIYD